MRKSGKIWVRADKSKTKYQISPYDYDQILDKITESYRIDHNDTPTLINSDAAKFASAKDRLQKLKE